MLKPCTTSQSSEDAKVKEVRRGDQQLLRWAGGWCEIGRGLWLTNEDCALMWYSLEALLESMPSMLNLCCVTRQGCNLHVGAQPLKCLGGAARGSTVGNLLH